MTNEEIKQKLFEISTELNKVNDELFKKKELNAYLCMLEAIDNVDKAFEKIIESEKKESEEQ